jgi:hypothetical protein
VNLKASTKNQPFIFLSQGFLNGFVYFFLFREINNAAHAPTIRSLLIGQYQVFDSFLAGAGELQEQQHQQRKGTGKKIQVNGAWQVSKKKSNGGYTSSSAAALACWTGTVIRMSFLVMRADLANPAFPSSKKEKKKNLYTCY